MGRGRGSFARVAARATCRELNKKRKYRSSNSTYINNNTEDASVLAVILAVLIVGATVGFFIWIWSTAGIFGTMAVIFIILFFKALLG